MSVFCTIRPPASLERFLHSTRYRVVPALLRGFRGMQPWALRPTAGPGLAMPFAFFMDGVSEVHYFTFRPHPYASPPCSIRWRSDNYSEFVLCTPGLDEISIQNPKERCPVESFCAQPWRFGHGRNYEDWTVTRVFKCVYPTLGP